MRIIRSVHHKSCADGSFMKEFLLDAPMTTGFFSCLENFRQVEALPHAGDGFYTFEKIDWFSIKGFAGDTTVEVRFKKEVMDLTVDFVYSLFSLYREVCCPHGNKARDRTLACPFPDGATAGD